MSDLVFEDESGNEYEFTDEDEEEWVFEEESDEEEITEVTRRTQGSLNTGARSLQKFASSYSREKSTPAEKVSRSASATSNVASITPPLHTTPSVVQKSTIDPKIVSPSLQRPTKKEEKVGKLEDEQGQLADQIAALRIIASKGQDTKYLSIRSKKGDVAPTPPKIDPFVVAAGNDPRTNIVAEIITTEQSYVNDLEILIRLYLVPLSSRVKKKKKPIITTEQVRGLFSNVESILNLNRVLLADLETQASLPPAEQRIGASFLLVAKCLLLYTDYCSNQKNADALYTQLKASNSGFNALLEENVLKPESRLLDLNAFLIKPVQRACKYPLLLRELLKNTSETHADYEDLKEAFEAMQTSCLKLNERKRDVENMSHFLTIKSRTGKNFIESGRTFVEDGRIKIITEKQNKRTGKVKFRLRKGRYVLFSDMVVFICEGKVIAQIPLATCQMADPKIAAHPLAILLLARAAKLILLPSTEQEKTKITQLISEQLKTLQERSQSRLRGGRPGTKKMMKTRKPAGNSAAAPSRIACQDIFKGK